MSTQWKQNRAQANGLQRMLFGLLIGIGLILGLFASALFFGLALLASGFLALRLWWMRRQLIKPRRGNRAVVIEGEYRIIEHHTGQGRAGHD